MPKARSFAIVQILNSGKEKIVSLNLGWTRAVGERNLKVCQCRNLGNFRLATVELDYLGMGRMANFVILPAKV